jgi:hypothetical protein
MISLDAEVMPAAMYATDGAFLLMPPCALVLLVKAHHARPRTVVDSCSRALATGLVLLVVLLMLRLTTAAAGHRGRTWQTLYECNGTALLAPYFITAQIPSATVCSWGKSAATEGRCRARNHFSPRTVFARQGGGDHFTTSPKLVPPRLQHSTNEHIGRGP